MNLNVLTLSFPPETKLNLVKRVGIHCNVIMELQFERKCITFCPFEKVTTCFVSAYKLLTWLKCSGQLILCSFNNLRLFIVVAGTTLSY